MGYNFKEGFLSSPNPMAALYHEMAHGLFTVNHKWIKKQQQTALKVSRYGSSSPREFVAEVYAGIKTGQSYDDDVMELFKSISILKIK
jgi:hypothetical protein